MEKESYAREKGAYVMQGIIQGCIATGALFLLIWFVLLGIASEDHCKSGANQMLACTIEYSEVLVDGRSTQQ
jgi:hypothetical protein